jgi:4'-phosphopantetheinyl transferase
MSRDRSSPDPAALPTEAAVWVVALDGTSDAAVDALARRWLDADERSRASGRRDPDDRRRALASHLALRSVLGSWLDQHPGDVGLARAACPLCGEAHGRPVLSDPVLGAHHSFSLARAAGIAAIAIAGSVAIGVDVESLPPRTGAFDLGVAHHPEEAAALDALPRHERDLAALRCWTRKEAVLKGWGTGLGVDPATVAVGLGSTPEPGHVHVTALPSIDIPEHGLHRSGWTVADVGVGGSVVVAAAIGSDDVEPAPVSGLADLVLHEVTLAELLGLEDPGPGTAPRLGRPG